MYKDKKVSVIIAAAGNATRMGGINKQYIEIGGMSVLARSAKAFERNAYTDEIIIAVRAGDEENCAQNIVEQYNLRKVKQIVTGGEKRVYSVLNALKAISQDVGIVLVHDGVRPFVTQRLIHDIIVAADETGAAVPCVSVKDTIKMVGGGFVTQTPDRAALRAVQTPQGFQMDLLKAAYEKAIHDDRLNVTDDSSVVEAFGHTVAVVDSDETNLKITTQADVRTAVSLVEEENQKSARPADMAEKQESSAMSPEYGGFSGSSGRKLSQEAGATAGGAVGFNSPGISGASDVSGDAGVSGVGAQSVSVWRSQQENDRREQREAERIQAFSAAASAARHATAAPHIGIGYDVHAFAEGRKLILGGVEIPHERGLLGYSDADVLVHAVMDALLGAAGFGDIGTNFPDSDPQYENISSLTLLERVGEMIAGGGMSVVNIDAVLIAERPKIAAFIGRMRDNMANALKIPSSQINIKGTTTEGLGFEGRQEGIAAQAAVCVAQLPRVVKIQ